MKITYVFQVSEAPEEIYDFIQCQKRDKAYEFNPIISGLNQNLCTQTHLFYKIYVIELLFINSATR